MYLENGCVNYCGVIICGLCSSSPYWAENLHLFAGKTPQNNTSRSPITSFQVPFHAVNSLCVIRGRSWYEKRAAEEPEGEKSVAEGIKVEGVKDSRMCLGNWA